VSPPVHMLPFYFIFFWSYSSPVISFAFYRSLWTDRNRHLWYFTFLTVECKCRQSYRPSPR